MAQRVVRALTHRSPVGPHREVVVLGHPACARCTALVGGAVGGAPLALVPLSAWALVALAVPAALEAIWEKVLRRPFRRSRLVVCNAALGLAVGAGLALLGLRAHPAVAVGVLLLARAVVPPILRTLRSRLRLEVVVA